MTLAVFPSDGTRPELDTHPVAFARTDAGRGEERPFAERKSALRSTVPLAGKGFAVRTELDLGCGVTDSAPPENDMAHYLMIESRDPFESNDVAYYYDLSHALVAAGNEVTMYLVQNAVMAARPSERSSALSELAKKGVKVLADDFSLRERGLSRLAEGISIAAIEVVVDHLSAGHKVIWH